MNASTICDNVLEFEASYQVTPFDEDTRVFLMSLIPAVAAVVESPNLTMEHVIVSDTEAQLFLNQLRKMTPESVTDLWNLYVKELPSEPPAEADETFECIEVSSWLFGRQCFPTPRCISKFFDANVLSDVHFGICVAEPIGCICEKRGIPTWVILAMLALMSLWLSPAAAAPIRILLQRLAQRVAAAAA